MIPTPATQFGSSGSNGAAASLVEAEYQTRIEAMLPKDRVARTAAMFEWVREAIGRQIRSDQAAQGRTISDEELKGRIALRLYGGEPAVVALIQRRLDDVSG